MPFVTAGTVAEMPYQGKIIPPGRHTKQNLDLLPIATRALDLHGVTFLEKITFLFLQPLELSSC